jgi:hypothetical protein
MSLGVNLLLNPGAEIGASSDDDTGVNPPPDWTTTGNFTQEEYTASSVVAPSDGSASFFYGGPGNSESTASQTVSISDLTTQINAGQVDFTLSGELGGYQNQDDHIVLSVTWLDASGDTLATDDAPIVYAETRGDTSEFLPESVSGAVPVGAVSATVEMDSTRAQGSDNDGYADNVSLILNTACFCRGTLIRTPDGETPIEQLNRGDMVLTASGAARPVAWTGHRRLDLSKHARPWDVRPVRIGRGAFGEGLPHRDLWVSPGHNIAWKGVLLPASLLINDRSIRQVQADEVEYWHVELETHDIIFSEGLASESYLDCGNRAAFANCGAFIEAHPDFQPKHWRDTCLPIVKAGGDLVAARRRLLSRCAELGHEMDEDSDVHLVVDGRRVEPIWFGAAKLAFSLSAGRRSIRLQSRTFVPAHVCAESFDARELGVCVERLQIDGEEVALDDERLVAADWRASERDETETIVRRWTRGCAALPADARLVSITLGSRGFYWRDDRRGLIALSA